MSKDKVFAKLKFGPRRDASRYQHIATAEISAIGNQAPYFAVTVDTWNPGADVQVRQPIACGCQHDVVEAWFPKLAKYLKWHLTSVEGPMHYIANTVYHASNRDYNGRAAGEPDQFAQGVRIGNSPISHQLKQSFWEFLRSRHVVTDTTPFTIMEIPHKKEAIDSYVFAPKYTFEGYGTQWHECPFNSRAEAEEWQLALNDRELSVMFLEFPTHYSKGKAREFAAARSCAVWPEATDAQLSLPKEELTKLLEARHPALMAEFQADMLELFGEDTWSSWKPVEQVTTETKETQNGK